MLRRRAGFPTSQDLFEARWERFLKGLSGAERAWLVETRRNSFLDAYSEWMTTRSPRAYQVVVRAARALTEIDPTFRYPASRRPHHSHA